MQTVLVSRHDKHGVWIWYRVSFDMDQVPCVRSTTFLVARMDKYLKYEKISVVLCRFENEQGSAENNTQTASFPN